jgi:hypothetical protein
VEKRKLKKIQKKNDVLIVKLNVHIGIKTGNMLKMKKNNKRTLGNFIRHM